MEDSQDKTLIDRIIELLRDNNPDGFFKEFYYGDLDQYPREVLPCVSVEPEDTNILTGPTGMDEIEQTVTIRVVYDLLDEVGRSDNEMVGVRAVQGMVEGIDPTTNEYDSKTIAGILRKNFTLAANAVNQKMQIRYGVIPRGEDEATKECQITFTVKNYKLVSNRV